MNKKQFWLYFIYLIRRIINLLFTCGIIISTIYLINIILTNPLLYEIPFYIASITTIAFATLLNILSYKTNNKFRKGIDRGFMIPKRNDQEYLFNNIKNKEIYLLSGKEIDYNKILNTNFQEKKTVNKSLTRKK